MKYRFTETKIPFKITIIDFDDKALYTAEELTKLFEDGKFDKSFVKVLKDHFIVEVKEVKKEVKKEVLEEVLEEGIKPVEVEEVDIKPVKETNVKNKASK